MNTEYEIRVFFSPEDDVWVADIPALRHCSAHGRTPHEAVAEVEIAAEAWLEAAASTGRPVPEPTTRRVQA